MSTRQKPPSDAQLVQAAELRIGNHTWEAVGKKLNRAAETVRRWPTLYAERWRTALHHAERRFAVDCQSEAVVALRFLLRDKDSKIVWHAPWSTKCWPLLRIGAISSMIPITRPTIRLNSRRTSKAS